MEGLFCMLFAEKQHQDSSSRTAALESPAKQPRSQRLTRKKGKEEALAQNLAHAFILGTANARAKQSVQNRFALCYWI